MGSSVSSGSAPVAIALDIGRGPDWVGKPLLVEVVGPGSDGPKLLDVIPINVPSDDQPPLTFTAQPNGAWMFLRIIDPDRPNHPLARAPFDNGGAFAYASPWFFGSA
jgi:hypothetical protein